MDEPRSRAGMAYWVLKEKTLEVTVVLPAVDATL
jgi:hypothetical protein